MDFDKDNLRIIMLNHLNWLDMCDNLTNDEIIKFEKKFHYLLETSKKIVCCYRRNNIFDVIKQLEDIRKLIEENIATSSVYYVDKLPDGYIRSDYCHVVPQVCLFYFDMIIILLEKLVYSRKKNT
ncbi:unnamed protein product [Cunninghamella echinulata]